MKKLFLLFVFCCFAGAASAQYVEVVHLKNGGIIRGIIIEQIPNENLKIQTNDGNVFVYWFDEIEKITKETNSSGMFYRPGYFRQTRTPRYQASVDVGRAFGVGFWKSERIELSSTHGCLINPSFYVGAGVHFHYDAHAIAIPIFADVRGNLTKKNVKPFLNFRIGYSVGDVKGVYLTPSVGMHINVFEFSVGYTYQSAKMYIYEGSYWNGWEASPNLGAVTLKVGVRF